MEEKYQKDRNTTASMFVQSFRMHYPNIRSFASQISRFKSQLKNAGCSDIEFLGDLKPTSQESKEVHRINKARLELRCKNESITLKGVGDQLILLFRSWLNSDTLGELYVGIAALTGLRLTEIICRANLEPPTVTHSYTDNAYWSYCTGILKKPKGFKGHEKPLLERRIILLQSLCRLRKLFFAKFQEADHDNRHIASQVSTKVNRAIRKVWVFIEVPISGSHWFRSFYCNATSFYMNRTSSISAWVKSVLCHESIYTSLHYTSLMITGYGTLNFESQESVLKGLTRLQLS